MDDDHEVLSQNSASPNASPSPNGRITVTVASSVPRSLSPPEEKNLALALPAQQPQKANGGGREDCWSESATAVLIEAWGERYMELSRGNLKQTHWKEVADIVSSREEYGKTPKTDIQCKNRIDTVKKKYKMEKAKIASGGAPSRWVFFDKLDRLIGPSAKTGPNSSGGGSSGKVPVGIPVGVRTAMNQFRTNHGTRGHDQKKSASKKRPSSRKRALMDSDEDDDEEEEEEDFSADSMDSLPPPPPPKKTVKLEKEIASPKRESKKWGSSMRELTRAILRFGEAYEAAESAKLQQVVEMEKQRMKFAKDLELQRMQFFMKTQLEISQLKHVKRGGGRIAHASNHHHHHHQQHGNVNNSESSS